VESTSSQVNQKGGYTGQTPEEFAKSIRSAATQAGLAAGQVLLGGDHLGPFPWRTQNSSIAMEKACALVHACVSAGYQKIHLDASMPCADDLKNPLAAEVVAQRAAVLAEAAEKAFAELRPGSDPIQYTLETFRSAFAGRKLSEAWGKIIALVVQPGVEFGDDVVFPYDREKARLLSSVLPKDSSIVYEAHSTDYLRRL
jgi:D-tagatose-1,6-bisphosphate aldolase subunit GatZ/KbaZ